MGFSWVRRVGCGCLLLIIALLRAGLCWAGRHAVRCCGPGFWAVWLLVTDVLRARLWFPWLSGAGRVFGFGGGLAADYYSSFGLAVFSVGVWSWAGTVLIVSVCSGLACVVRVLLVFGASGR